jgi:hypothetical protein
MGGFDAIKDLAEKLIPKHHPHLANAIFEYVSRSKASKQAGKPVAGTVKKASPLERRLASKDSGEEPNFIMIVALDVWNNLQSSQRTALIDHLLTRCTADEDDSGGEIKYGVRPPEVQEFPEVAGRHGRWNESLSHLATELGTR